MLDISKRLAIIKSIVSQHFAPDKFDHFRKSIQTTVEMEQPCEECGGSGFDPGGVDPWGPEPCPRCHGTKIQTAVRNYLAEAFQIAANPDCTRPVERHHLVAVIQHCREVVSAMAILPDVA